MNTIYGHFNDNQMDQYKTKLHKKMFWLLLYKDPKTREQYSYIDFNKYMDGLMREIDGLNHLLLFPEEIVEIMSNLEAALIETNKSDFNYQTYRKLILDAHSLIDEIGGEKK